MRMKFQLCVSLVTSRHTGYWCVCTLRQSGMAVPESSSATVWTQCWRGVCLEENHLSNYVLLTQSPRTTKHFSRYLITKRGTLTSLKSNQPWITWMGNAIKGQQLASCALQEQYRPLDVKLAFWPTISHVWHYFSLIAKADWKKTSEKPREMKWGGTLISVNLNLSYS